MPRWSLTPEQFKQAAREEFGAAMSYDLLFQQLHDRIAVLEQREQAALAENERLQARLAAAERVVQAAKEHTAYVDGRYYCTHHLRGPCSLRTALSDYERQGEAEW